MLVLTKKAIQACFSMSDALKASRIALEAYSAGQANVPLRTNIPIEQFNGQTLYMPAAIEGEMSAAGIKVVSVYPDNIEQGLPSVPASMIVVDAKTGLVTAVLDGTFLTQLRTGAVQGVATDLLARKDAKIAALIGTGGQATQQALAMLMVRQLEELRVYDINAERAKEFAAYLETRLGTQFTTRFRAVASAKEAVCDADIVTTVTTSHQPTFDARDIKAGAHVNGVGAYTADMVELPSDLFERAGAIVFDTIDGVMNEAGDVMTALRLQAIEPSDITGELGQLLSGTILGRQSDQEVTLFKTVGSAVLDVVTAQLIVDKALTKGVGVQID
ncbi:ornithine cyclodeaminase family protein [Streptococcus gallolyticus]|uniref:Ornithine cyclodeaminase family protein n=1 Tax=Streptococcus gallolyticus TaxID=315405 RepID=A0A368UB65_9STRE|nr:ornithine cyclodeaminase family protein [Streptococcus gallolyticus]RCW16251.1 ornithine cyclodeaminase family protein [Streptococcus gallolyticus]